MNTLADPFDLGFLADPKIVVELVTDQLGASASHVRKVGEGFYAHVYQVELDRAPEQAIVKCHKFPERGRREAQQLQVCCASTPRCACPRSMPCTLALRPSRAKH